MSQKNTGAPAALARLEKEELQCYDRKEEIAKELAEQFYLFRASPLVL